MAEEKNKPIGDKLGSLLSLVRNVKFLLLSAISLVILGLAIISGDGKNIILNSYENLTGRKFQTFSPVQDYSNETYLVLEAKLSRDANFELENAKVTVFKESDTLHKYRVAVNDEIHIYKIERKNNGAWLIEEEKHE